MLSTSPCLVKHWSFDMTLLITDLRATLETLRTLISQEINNSMFLSEKIRYERLSQYAGLEIDFILGNNGKS